MLPSASPACALPALPCLSIITSSAAVTFADPSPQMLEGGLRSSTRSFGCSPRSPVLLFELYHCLRPLMASSAVAARSPRGHGGCPLRAPSPAGTLASTGPAAGCAARDQTRCLPAVSPHTRTDARFSTVWQCLARDLYQHGDHLRQHRWLLDETRSGMAGSW